MFRKSGEFEIPGVGVPIGKQLGAIRLQLLEDLLSFNKSCASTDGSHVDKPLLTRGIDP